ncbi:hypothetical protein [Paraclostridium sordellii]|nr:hypothetical protein [Paeniclostridium sordellii]
MYTETLCHFLADVAGTDLSSASITHVVSIARGAGFIAYISIDTI